MSESMHPYEPPKFEALTKEGEGRDPYRSIELFAFAIAVILVGVLLGRSLPRSVSWLSEGVLFVGGLFAFVAVLVSAADAISALRRHGVIGIIGIVALVGVLVMGFLSVLASGRGRQLRRFGRVLLPPLRKGDAWAGPSALDLPPTYVAAARVSAAQWRENGRTEHASVAAFAALSMDLMALGAPPELLAAANQDALDEIRHTKLCFSLARALDGRSDEPGPFPDARKRPSIAFGRTYALARLAAESVLEGALLEGVSARVVAKLAKRCESPVVCDMLKQIARDEGRHAAHGWDVVLWCVEQGGAPVVRALEASIHALPVAMKCVLPAEARDGSWERFGIPSQALEHEEYTATRESLSRRVRGLARAKRQSSLPCSCPMPMESECCAGDVP